MDNNTDFSPDIIMCTRNIENHIKAKVIPDLTSDHLAIELEVDLKTSTQLTNKPARKNFNQYNSVEVNKEITEYIKTRTINITR